MNEQSLHVDTVNDWIVGYLTGSLTSKENLLLQEWLAASEENKHYFSDIQEIWLAASDKTEEPKFDKEQAYKSFLKRKEVAQLIGMRGGIFWMRPWMYAVAMVVMVFLCGIIAFQSGKRVIREQLARVTIESPYGSKTKLYLPDGTLVWLNAGSTISYAQDFGISERLLTLSGEAYFEVTKNKKLPFKVHTDELDVNVLGTKFNFRNYHNDAEAKVCLLEGKVALETHGKKTVLYPDHQALLNKQTGNLAISGTKALYSAEWKNGTLYFDEVLLSDIVRELERSYDVHITVVDTVLNGIRFYGNFRRQEQSIQEVMDVLSSTDKMTYTINHGKDGSVRKDIVIMLP